MFWVYGLIAFMGTLLSLQIEQRQGNKADSLQVEAGNLLLWHDAAVKSARTHPEKQGTLVPDSLFLPSGYRPLGKWKSLYTKGHVITWAEQTSSSQEVFSHSLEGLMKDNQEGGRVHQGKMRTREGYKMSIPSQVPEGVFVLIIRVNP